MESVVVQASVLLADDNRPVLQHVSKMLESATDFRVVAAVSDGKAVVRECLSRRPDIVVLDISMGDTSGIDVATQLRDEGCPSKIVFLTVHQDPDFLNAAMGAGGRGYVVKSRLSTDLISALNAAMSDKMFVSPCMLYQPNL
jgi:DNA-binding NarL/FixJ family response regulator